MNRGLVAVLIACVWATALFYRPAQAAEDTAQITFSKTAVARQDLQIYTVRKGDTLSAIVRKLPDVRERDIPELYRLIGELNPDIDDLNTLRTGLPLVVPGKVISDTAAPPPTTASASRTADTPTTKRAYTVKRGDSLIRIVHRELNIKSNTQSTLITIKTLNPSITDVNRIFEGQTIILPEASIMAPSATGRPDEVPDKISVATSVKEDDTGKKQPISMSAEARLAAVKQIITAMNGTMITSDDRLRGHSRY